MAVSGTTVTLTMANAAVYGDTMTISYTPGTNRIKDAAGNEADALTDQAVTNNTAAPYAFDEGSVTEAVEGGAGVSQTINFTNTGVAFTGNEYVVVQITTGTGEAASNTLVMMKVQVGTQEVTVSYESDATTVTVWLTSGLPDVTSDTGTGVTSYDTCDLK